MSQSTIKHYEEIFWYRPHKKFGPKTIYFQRLCNSMATLRANIFGEEHDIDNWETALETMKGPLLNLQIS